MAKKQSSPIDERRESNELDRGNPQVVRRLSKPELKRKNVKFVAWKKHIEMHKANQRVRQERIVSRKEAAQSQKKELNKLSANRKIKEAQVLPRLSKKRVAQRLARV
ncbi:MAG: hypothetical protein EXS12_09430, partial [Phycisphaerales bacterium]|nr:hypothetical protein [Phycisphaerales bacterium]